MLNEYPSLEKGKITEFYEGLKPKEKELIENYLVYRQARGLKDKSMFKNVRRMILQPRYILQHPVTSMTLEELRKVLSIINNSKLATHYKNNVKANFKNFIKYAIPDWSIRFSNLEDIKTNGVNKHNEERINHNTLFTKEDVDKLLKAELSIKWRTFLLLQYEGGLRTIEVRSLKWNDCKIDIEDGLTELNIFSSKTKKSRVVYVKEATHYLKLLRTEQENNKDKGLCIFHMRSKPDLPIAKYSVNEWFRKLCKNVLGREGWNYLLRHSRATELYKLAEENKISKDTAIKFMGHSDDMSKIYNHPNPSDVKKMLREQVYNIEDLPEEEKHELEQEVETLKERMKELEKKRESSDELINELTGNPETLKMIAQAIARLGLVGKVQRL